MELDKTTYAIAQKMLHYGCASFFIGCLAWLAIILAIAPEIRDASYSAYAEATFGPLVLNTMSKQLITSGQYSLSFTFEYGLVAYSIIWFALGAGIAFTRSRFGRSPSNKMRQQ